MAATVALMPAAAVLTAAAVRSGAAAAAARPADPVLSCNWLAAQRGSHDWQLRGYYRSSTDEPLLLVEQGALLVDRVCCTAQASSASDALW